MFIAVSLGSAFDLRRMRSMVLLESTEGLPDRFLLSVLPQSLVEGVSRLFPERYQLPRHMRVASNLRLGCSFVESLHYGPLEVRGKLLGLSHREKQLTA